jgi:ubiquinone/menaquinone biosynthesis C-methylase UbiE
MASESARREGVAARFIHGSASDIPLEDGLFDLIVCRAAFKNFSEPQKALNEMHRVLKPGGRALIIDLRKDAPWDEVAEYVDGLHLSSMDSWFTKFTFKHMLLKRAYTTDQITSLAQQSNFGTCQIVKARVGMEINLVRRLPLQEQVA